MALVHHLSIRPSTHVYVALMNDSWLMNLIQIKLIELSSIIDYSVSIGAQLSMNLA